MPAPSRAQQKVTGAALAARRDEQPGSKLRGASSQREKSMSGKQLKAFAITRREGLAGTKD